MEVGEVVGFNEIVINTDYDGVFLVDFILELIC